MTKEQAKPPRETRHVSISIDRPPAEVYAFAADTANLPRWASGLATMMDKVRFAEQNSFGVLDHDVLLDSGETIHNPMRIVGNMGGSEVIFTLIRPPDMSPEQLAEDTATIHNDLVALKRLVEAEPVTPRHDSARHEHHGIDYIELTVTDLEAAIRFYAAAFGWQFNRYGPGYAGIQGSGREVGGLRADKSVARGGPLVVLYSRDLDATLNAIRDAGGRVLKEPYDFPGGRRFHFSDPSGNELAVWSSS